MIRLLAAGILALLASTPDGLARDVKLDAVDRGIEIDAGDLGRLLLSPPNLVVSDQVTHKPAVKASGREVRATYPDGSELVCKVGKDEVECRFEKPPAAGSYMFALHIPLRFNQGGAYSVDGRNFTPFPADIHSGLEAEQFLARGQASGFRIRNAQGDGLELETKSNWFGLQDTRVWNTPEFTYQFLIDPKAARNGKAVFTFSLFKDS